MYHTTGKSLFDFLVLIRCCNFFARAKSGRKRNFLLPSNSMPACIYILFLDICTYAVGLSECEEYLLKGCFECATINGFSTYKLSIYFRDTTRSTHLCVCICIFYFLYYTFKILNFKLKKGSFNCIINEYFTLILCTITRCTCTFKTMVIHRAKY